MQHDKAHRRQRVTNSEYGIEKY